MSKARKMSIRNQSFNYYNSCYYHMDVFVHLEKKVYQTINWMNRKIAYNHKYEHSHLLLTDESTIFLRWEQFRMSVCIICCCFFHSGIYKLDHMLLHWTCDNKFNMILTCLFAFLFRFSVSFFFFSLLLFGSLSRSYLILFLFLSLRMSISLLFMTVCSLLSSM